MASTTDMRRALKGMLSLKVGSLLSQFHGTGHDEKSHGNWARGMGDEGDFDINAARAEITARRKKNKPDFKFESAEGRRGKPISEAKIDPHDSQIAWVSEGEIDGAIETAVRNRNIRDNDFIVKSGDGKFVDPRRPKYHWDRDTGKKVWTNVEGTGHVRYRLEQAGVGDLDVEEILRTEKPVHVEIRTSLNRQTNKMEPSKNPVYVYYVPDRLGRNAVLNVTYNERNGDIVTVHIENLYNESPTSAADARDLIGKEDGNTLTRLRRGRR